MAPEPWNRWGWGSTALRQFSKLQRIIRTGHAALKTSEIPHSTLCQHVLPGTGLKLLVGQKDSGPYHMGRPMLKVVNGIGEATLLFLFFYLIIYPTC